MIALDTNVLVRVLVADDPEQTDEARRLLVRAERERARVYLSNVVLCETAWVLRSVYGLTRDEIADALTSVLVGDLVVVGDAGVIERALRALREGGCDFADYVIRESSLAAGAQAVATFDGRALSERGFVRPDPDAWPADLDLREEAPPYRRRRVLVS